MHAEDIELVPAAVQHDNDTKFTAAFDEVFLGAGIEVRKPAPFSPNLNAHIERFIQSVEHECLDSFLVVGEKHLNHISREFLTHYNGKRAALIARVPAAGLEGDASPDGNDPPRKRCV